MDQGKRFRLLLLNKDIQLKDAADKMGVKRTTLQTVLSKSRVKEEYHILFRDVLGISIEDRIDPDDPKADYMKKKWIEAVEEGDALKAEIEKLKKGKSSK